MSNICPGCGRDCGQPSPPPIVYPQPPLAPPQWGEPVSPPWRPGELNTITCYMDGKAIASAAGRLGP